MGTAAGLVTAPPPQSPNQRSRGCLARATADEPTLTYLSEKKVPCPYPYPYGFILNTRGEDGEAVDCFVLNSRTLEAGAIVVGRAVGLLELIEDGEIDHKILAALPGSEPEPVLDPALHERLRDFITSLFRAYPSVHIEVGRILGPEEATLFLASHGS